MGRVCECEQHSEQSDGRGELSSGILGILIDNAVLAIKWTHTFHPAIPDKHPTRQSIPSRVVIAKWEHVDPSRVSSLHI